VTRGKGATIRYSVKDALPSSGIASVTMKVRTLGGHLVRTIHPTDVLPNVGLTARFTCRLRRGAYRFAVYAVDGAGNRQVGVDTNRLAVL
jgi:hypothetical protein